MHVIFEGVSYDYVAKVLWPKICFMFIFVYISIYIIWYSEFFGVMM